MMPETLSNSERRYDHENVGWLKTSQVNRRGGVFAPHRCGAHSKASAASDRRQSSGRTGSGITWQV